ncbi:MAG: sugar ABC transporter ATP-binding protein [Sedimentisphaerales bacterium]|jgi:ABC-type sugar transport system ATPase subunit
MTSIIAEGKEGRPALVMRGISKRFGAVQALAGVDLSVRRGTVHAIVGENGAGKTTLMKILAGVYQPDAGTIEINGRGHSFDGPQQAIEAGVSMIYQDLDLAEHLTVAENVFLGNEPRRGLHFVVDLKKMAAATANLADGFGFEINPTAAVSSLSTGDCQVAEILKALARKASIIVMDEPTSSLSEDEASRLFEIIRRLKNSDISIIYISHRLDEITGLADDVTILRDGKVVHCGQMAGLDTKTIVRYMVGRELTDFYPARKTAIRDVVAEVKNLSSQKIQDINFNVRAGEIVGMAGLVGAGRTEVARTIFGVDKKTSGAILLEGQEVEIKSPAEAIANGIAFLTEDRKRSGLCLGLACSWNITLAALGLIGMRRIIRPAKETAIADNLGKQLAIKWTSPERQVDTLSGGNQQKLLIARWLLAEAKFLIFDEPTRGIDVGAKKEVYTLLNNLAGQGKAILFISSELPELLGVTDRILVMRRGRLVGDLKTNETTQEEVMHLAAVETS